jgi:hypothetical protein
MNYKIITLLIVLVFIVGTACAAAPTVADVTVSPSYTNDYNYFADSVTISAVASGDVNADSECWYLIATEGTATAGDWNADTNTCSKTIASIGVTDDVNFQIIVLSGTNDANGESPVAYYYLDNNAPTSTATISGIYLGSVVTISCTDAATNTGNGSGCKAIYYSTDGGTNYSSTTSSSVNIQLNEIGGYDVNYYVVDQLDNTSATSQTSYTITSMPASNYGMIALALFMTAVALVVFAIFGIFAGKLDMTQFFSILVAVLITLLVAWTIYGTTIVV